jgi:SAM-dependent methyltransferase
MRKRLSVKSAAKIFGVVLLKPSLFDRYLSWRRKTFPASKEDVASRHECIIARLDEIEKALSSNPRAAQAQPNDNSGRPVLQKRSVPDKPPVYRRFLSDQRARTSEFLQSAKEYVEKLPEASYAYLYEKPFDRLSGPPSSPAQLHAIFYQEIYQVLNLLRAMEIPFGGRVLEVGSGPGWVSEILLGLGYSVDGIDPSADMIRIANERVDGFLKHHRIDNPSHFAFHCCTLEDCALPHGSFDAIFFHASLHHVIDENEGLVQCLRLLKPGGVIGVSESCWQPGNVEMEAILNQEMEKFGTLESPFTIDYLDFLLSKHGFVDVERYHSVNGLFPLSMSKMPLQDIAQSPASASNILTARKPEVNHWRGPTIADENAETKTKAAIEVLSFEFTEVESKVSLKLRLRNCGETAWLNKPGCPGSVYLALYRGAIGAADFQEAIPRQSLPLRLLPNEEWIGEFAFRVPGPFVSGEWRLDLISEYLFWFSARGNPAVSLDLQGSQSRGAS